MRFPSRLCSWLATLMILPAATVLADPVDCDVPDDLCTGDPCVVEDAVQVAASCVLDFGARHLVLRGRILMPNAGELSLRAASMEVRSFISNRRGTEAPPVGPRITLSSSGNIDFRGRIRLQGVKGIEVPGEIRLDADGTLEAAGNVSAHTSPTTIVYRGLGGGMTFTGRVRTAKGGGSMTIESGGDLVYRGVASRLDDLTISSTGDVDIRRRLAPRQNLVIDAEGVATVGSQIRLPGLDVSIQGAAGVVIENAVKVMPLFLLAGSIDLTSSSGPVSVLHTLFAHAITITAHDDVLIEHVVSARPPARSGGTIDIVSTAGGVFVHDWLRAQSGDGELEDDGAGGHISITAAGRVEVTDDISVNAFHRNDDAPGGTLHITAGEIEMYGKRYKADGKVPGAGFPGVPAAGFRLTSTSGDITVSGRWESGVGPSLMNFDSAGDLTLAGVYTAGPNGCIGLSAVGSIDSSQMDADTAPVQSCPE